MPVGTQRGGAEATLLQLLEEAPEDTAWHVIFLEDGPLVQTVERLGVAVSVVEAGRFRHLPDLTRAVRRIGSILRSWQADVVCSWMGKGHLYGGPAASALRLPAVWFQHGMPSASNPIDRLATALPARAVLTPSRTVARAQSELRPYRPTRVAYPGVTVDRDANGRPAALNDLGLSADARLVGLVGRLQHWKGAHVLVEALPGVVGDHPDTHLVIVGGDHPLERGYREQLERLAERFDVRQHVHLIGYQPDPAGWMRACDVVVHASDNEPFGLVVLEAMALGKPLVAGAEGGPVEMVQDGVEGFLVPFGDSRGLARAVGRYLADPELGRLTGAAAARRAAEFSPARFATDVVQTLRVATRR